MFQLTQNTLKRVKMQKKFTPFDPLCASRVARSSRKFSKKKSVSQSTRNALKRIEMQKKNLYPFDRLRASRVAQSASAKREWRSATLPIPCHPQCPKECPCQVSCRSDQNCDQKMDSYIYRIHTYKQNNPAR